MHVWQYNFSSLNFTDRKKCEEGCNAKNDWHVGLSEARLEEMEIEITMEKRCQQKRDIDGLATLRRRGGMKVKATQAAISRPATTALIAKSRGIVRIRKDCIFIACLSLALVLYSLFYSITLCRNFPIFALNVNIAPIILMFRIHAPSRVNCRS